ncbi:hypothetical protein FDQ82_23220 [Escherichia coli]|nr:hypothetical protein [Escherichia coli]EFD4923302.1 hypothetical protein [Escherichia coli]
MTGHRTFLVHNRHMLEQQTWDNVPGVNTTNFLNNCRSPASTACYIYSMKDKLELLLNEMGPIDG